MINYILLGVFVVYALVYLGAVFLDRHQLPHKREWWEY